MTTPPASFQGLAPSRPSEKPTRAGEILAQTRPNRQSMKAACASRLCTVRWRALVARFHQRPCRAALHQRHRDYNFGEPFPRRLDLVNGHHCKLPSKLYPVDSHRCQRGNLVLSIFVIVEADERQITGNPDALLGQAVPRPERDVVGSGKNSGNRTPFFQKQFSARIPVGRGRRCIREAPVCFRSLPGNNRRSAT